MPTQISWADETWNPTTGCSRVSDGCRFCYAETLSLRFGWSKAPWTHNNAPQNVVLHPARLTKRPERAALWPGPWTPNIWMGTSVEDRRVLGRIEALRLCDAQTRFLSCE